ncbi:MAG: hypothetical protein AAGL29_09200 [Bacteroidota bacterium]
MAKFIIGIQNAYHGKDSTLVTLSLVKEMLIPQINTRGIGANLRGVERVEAFWHSGQNLGYTSLLYGLSNQWDGAVVLVNSDGGEFFIQEFMSSVAHAYEWPVLQSKPVLQISESLKNQLIGSYENLEKNKRLVIEMMKDRLVIKPESTKKGLELLRIEENLYTVKNAQDYLNFRFVFKKETIIGLEYLEAIGKKIKLTKVD